MSRPMLVQATAGGPHPFPLPHALVMDVGRITEMAGIHRQGGEISVGVNSNWMGLAHSSLLQPGAAALADAADMMEKEQPGGVLLHALHEERPDSPILLALAALDAQIEFAVRDSNAGIKRQSLPWQQALRNPPEQPHLPLCIRFSLPFWAAGSALHQEDNISPLQPDARRVAILVIIDSDSGQIAKIRLALAQPGRLPYICPTINKVTGKKPEPHIIEEAVLLAQPCQQKLNTDYALVLSSHLIREALDRALARAQAPAR